MSNLITNIKERIAGISNPEVMLEKIKQFDLVARTRKIEDWINTYGDPNIRDNIDKIDGLITEAKKLRTKLMGASNGLKSNIDRMKPGLNKATNNIKYLTKDIEEMNWYLKHWDIFGGFKSAVEGIYHTSKFADGIKELINLFKDRTFQDLMVSFR